MKNIWTKFILLIFLFSVISWLMGQGIDGVIAQIAGYLLFDKLKEKENITH